MDTMLYITSVKLLKPYPHQRVHCLLGLANLADSPGDLSFTMETVNNVFQGSKPQFLLRSQEQFFVTPMTSIYLWNQRSKLKLFLNLYSQNIFLTHPEPKPKYFLENKFSF